MLEEGPEHVHQIEGAIEVKSSALSPSALEGEQYSAP